MTTKKLEDYHLLKLVQKKIQELPDDRAGEFLAEIHNPFELKLITIDKLTEISLQELCKLLEKLDPEVESVVIDSSEDESAFVNIKFKKES